MNLAMIVFSALMMWKGLMAATGSDSPIVVVLSGSMEPAFQRGDILLLDNNRPDIHVGDIVVFKIAGALLPGLVATNLAQRTRDLLLLLMLALMSRFIVRLFVYASLSYCAGRDIPIVHRVLRVHVHRNAQGDESVDYLTKGDNNSVDDRNLYAPGQLWLKRSEIVGKAVASVPYVGMATILLNDYPTLKYVLIGLMGLLVLTGKDA